MIRAMDIVIGSDGSLLGFLVPLIPLLFFLGSILGGKTTSPTCLKKAWLVARIGWAGFFVSLVLVAGYGYLSMVQGALAMAPFQGLFYFDGVAAAMLILVSFLGAIILQYSVNYLRGELRQDYFFRWLSRTIGAVALMIVSGNLWVFFFAWLSTSLCLHRLLTFYPERSAGILAARKKFLISRLGDVCLVGAILLIGATYGTWNISLLLALTPEQVAGAGLQGEAVAFLLALGALLKSAQLPFHSWLPETMETPTPVSALMHAGIINAGGFLIIRLSPLFASASVVLILLTLLGVMTALFASMVMLTQTSVKKALAYSTIAQMGFMMMQCGLGAYSLALLHIIAHSLYKAHAFLSSGNVVQLSRMSWVPDGSGKAHPAWLAVSLGVASLGVIGVAHLLGVTWEEKPGLIALALILVFGVTQLIWNAFSSAQNIAILGRVAALTIGVCAAYFLLHEAAIRMFDAYVGVAPHATNLLQTLGLTVVLGFAGVLILQAQIPFMAQKKRWQAFYVHAANGFYLGTMANCLVQKIWPVSSTSTSK